MTEQEFMQLVCSIRRVKDTDYLDLPLESVSFDSLDLLELRVALEDMLGLPLTNEKFNSASKLRDLYQLILNHLTNRSSIQS